MNLGKLLGIVSPGLSATGLFGQSAQGSGSAMLGGMSPLLAALLHKKQQGAKDPNQLSPGSTAPPAPIAPPAPQAKGVQTEADRRRQMGLQLLQLGGQFANPSFGQRSY